MLQASNTLEVRPYQSLKVRPYLSLQDLNTLEVIQYQSLQIRKSIKLTPYQSIRPTKCRTVDFSGKRNSDNQEYVIGAGIYDELGLENVSNHEQVD